MINTYTLNNDEIDQSYWIGISMAKLNLSKIQNCYTNAKKYNLWQTTFY